MDDQKLIEFVESLQLVLSDLPVDVVRRELARREATIGGFEPAVTAVRGQRPKPD